MKSERVILKSISDLHQHRGLSKPKHPLISVFRLNEAPNPSAGWTGDMLMGFYCICIKKNANKFRYGQRYYDFDSGIMSFFSPNQLLAHETGEPENVEGISLNLHPDFLAGYPLAKSIKTYGFFSYEVNEALHLSEQEEEILNGIFTNIEREYNCNIDQFSQDVIIAQIELLLQYCNRFYNRQFITRKIANSEILIRFENLLNDYFNHDKVMTSGLPTVQFVAEELAISVDYLSDMLRSTTGQNTQQHIHNKLIEKAKDLLSTTSLSVKEIAYQLGFEYPQSFNKMFKKKTMVSPLEYRQSFN
jgi:AraC family transcriptional regulator, transcriptional activator of pobA